LRKIVLSSNFYSQSILQLNFNLAFGGWMNHTITICKEIFRQERGAVLQTAALALILSRKKASAQPGFGLQFNPDMLYPISRQKIYILSLS
jgi:hypothetical protein